MANYQGFKMRVLLFLLPVFALAQDGANYDIIERTLNFLLFFGILLYFIAKPLKQMYLNRITGIANRLESIAVKLRESNNKKDDAIKRVDEAKINAASFVETAKKEAVLLAEKIKKDTKNEILNLEKSFKDQKEFEERKMTKAVVSELLNEIFDDKNLKVDQKELINIILKKVG
ncbi:F0F1 ATP synthase subunit B [Campylobacter sp. PS10]|uniref:ATP synthase subunit b n=2 Tax=Campylobacter gastrosuis TaxID=2974576 RepID=A0ABT7HPT3_9BACT|nr:F0F1 ATP synthase subunit B [Campylobacter gastrosuis]MDL0088906.1 F0F1 ATP synthase subunit B [Campylobacter gastrosuis]